MTRASNVVCAGSATNIKSHP